MTKKLLIAAAGACAVAACAAAAAKKCAGADRTDRWERMRKRMDEMPADFPPRVMFDNVAATRANTEEILDLLREEPANPDEIAVVPAL